MTRRIGFCCQWFHHDRSLKKKQLEEIERPMNTRSTTVRWLNEHKDEAEAKLDFVFKHNIDGIKNLILKVSTLPKSRRMCRISSPILPVATQADWRYYWDKPEIIKYCEKHFAEAGELARKHDVKVSFHPGQFTVLASDNPEIVERSIDEFEYHVNMARWMGFGKSFQDGCKINVHISGRQGPQGIIKVLPRLTPEARNTITIENDENSWGLDASLELEKHVALVVDIHHHWCHSAGEYISANDDRIKRVQDSWRGVRPAMHYSVSREDLLADHPTSIKPDFGKLLEQGYKKAKLRAHSDYYWNDAVNEWAWTFTDDFDIMCESKAKNLASIDFYNRMTQRKKVVNL